MGFVIKTFLLLVCGAFLVAAIFRFVFTSIVGMFIAALIALCFFLAAMNVNAETYKYKNGLEIKAKDFQAASKLCFQKLTGGKYPGEEKGLDIIDICINPVTGKVK